LAYSRRAAGGVPRSAKQALEGNRPKSGGSLSSDRAGTAAACDWSGWATGALCRLPDRQTMVEQANRYRVAELAEALAFWIAASR
jgi:hypothetical protein